MVKWSDVWKAKNFGGLGIRRLHSLSQALLGKWLWRFSVERESLGRWRGVGLLSVEEVIWDEPLEGH